jgi:hypothetical protein
VQNLNKFFGGTPVTPKIQSTGGIDMYRLYDKGELLEKLKLFCDELGRKPRDKDIDNRQNFPSTMAFRVNFGSVFNAIHIVRPDLATCGKRYSDNYLKLEFLKAVKFYGKAPTKEEFDNFSRTIKSGIIVKRIGWNNLIKELNLKQNSPRYKKQELIKILKEEGKRLGRDLILDDFVNNKDLPNVCVFFNNFGSWENALAEAGFKIGRKTFYAKDGHKCLSTMELYIDNWLYKRNIKHDKEVFYPFHPIYNKNTRKRCDFYINGTYIEFFGLMRKKSYREKVKIKQKLIKELNLKVIFIYPVDLDKLDKIITTHKFGRKSSRRGLKLVYMEQEMAFFTLKN